MDINLLLFFHPSNIKVLWEDDILAKSDIKFKLIFTIDGIPLSYINNQNKLVEVARGKTRFVLTKANALFM